MRLRCPFHKRGCSVSFISSNDEILKRWVGLHLAWQHQSEMNAYLEAKRTFQLRERGREIVESAYKFINGHPLPSDPVAETTAERLKREQYEDMYG